MLKSEFLAPTRVVVSRRGHVLQWIVGSPGLSYKEVKWICIVNLNFRLFELNILHVQIHYVPVTQAKSRRATLCWNFVKTILTSSEIADLDFIITSRLLECKLLNVSAKVSLEGTNVIWVWSVCIRVGAIPLAMHYFWALHVFAATRNGSSSFLNLSALVTLDAVDVPILYTTCTG